MAVVDTTRAVIIAALAAAILVHADGLALIYLTAFTTGVGSALRSTAAATCVPRLVDPADLDRANGRVIAAQIVGNELAGPAAGGWLFGVAAVLPFAVNAGTLGIAVLLLLTLPSVFQPAKQPTPARGSAAVRRDLAEGLAWLRRHSDIRDLTVASGIISIMDAAWFAVLVLYVTQILHQKPGSARCSRSELSAGSRPARADPASPGGWEGGARCCFLGWSWPPASSFSGSPPT